MIIILLKLQAVLWISKLMGLHPSFKFSSLLVIFLKIKYYNLRQSDILYDIRSISKKNWRQSIIDESALIFILKVSSFSNLRNQAVRHRIMKVYVKSFYNSNQELQKLLHLLCKLFIMKVYVYVKPFYNDIQNLLQKITKYLHT